MIEKYQCLLPDFDDYIVVMQENILVCTKYVVIWQVTPKWFRENIYYTVLTTSLYV